jgi:acyl-[acyl-carrier-protein]-phospholipid O-acyltransferase / long-chain-fatty-acid--[acyl-carrier-protein] ligase
MNIVKALVRWLLTRLYRVEVKGLEYYRRAGARVLIVANHASYLDGVLLYAFLPDKLTFAVNTYIARAWWVRVGLVFVNFLPVDPGNPLSVKGLIRYLRRDNKAVIFPEGRITVTGSLMKVYQGPGLVADRSGAALLPLRIDGAQYTPFSRLRGGERLRWFPQITLTILPPRRFTLSDDLRGRARRNAVGQMLADLMTEMMFATSNYQRTVFQSLIDARRTHGGRRVVVEDIERKPLTYSQVITRAFILGESIARETRRGERIGILLPTAASTVVTLMALYAYGRVPAMLNFTAGMRGMHTAITAAEIRTVYTSRQFVTAAKMTNVVARLGEKLRIVYLEDIRDAVTWMDKIRGWRAALLAQRSLTRCSGHVLPDEAAVVLFTSGTEGTPKGVVLSHANLLANRAQIASRFAFSTQDVVLNVMPMFHAFGLTGGTLLPLLSGIRTFFYPTPLHYRIIPEIAYDINATIIFGTNTFLAAYARFAHPYDFYSLRYVFAGAEKLQEETRRLWADKFGLRIFEGYGVTETAPALAANTPMDYRAGSVGRLLPGVEYQLEAIPGVEKGGQLLVRGPNVMLGYLLEDQPGRLISPVAAYGEGWYDTGDIVDVDNEGYVWILGRAKRFAKLGGEMVSLAAVEELAVRAWPGIAHAAVSLPDPHKGEKLILLTEQPDATRQRLHEQARKEGISEINVPRKLFQVRKLPLLGTGKIDYGAARDLAERLDGGEGTPS